MFNKEVLQKIEAALLKKEHTIAVAESVTSGLLQAAFSTAKDAMQFFHGGITTYNLGQKARHLNINAIHAFNCNCVSQKMAEDMARSVCELFSSDWGIGVTGYAAPVPESDNKTFAYFSIVQHKEVKLTQKIDLKDEDSFKTQLHYVENILLQLAQMLEADAA